MAELAIRWTQDDLREDLPERFRKALARNGAAHQRVLRTMVRSYTLAVEAQPQTALEKAASDVVEHGQS